MSKDIIKELKKGVQNLMPNTDLIGHNGQYLVVQNLKEDGTFDYGLSKDFDLSNSEVEAWEQAGEIIRENLKYKGLYEKTFILDISEKAKEIYFDNLQYNVSELEERIHNIEDGTLAPNHFNKSISEMEQEINDYKKCIYVSKRTIEGSIEAQIKQPITYQNLQEKPIVLIVDQINKVNYDKQLSLMSKEQYDNITIPMAENDVAMLKFNNGHFGITQSLTTGEIKPIDLRDLHVLKPKQVLSYMKEVHPKILNELQLKNKNTFSQKDEIIKLFGNKENIPLDALHQTPYIYELSHEKLKAHKTLLENKTASNTLHKYDLRAFEEAIEKTDDLINFYSKDSKELKYEINKLTTEIESDTNYLVTLETIGLKDDEDLDMINHTKKNILKSKAKLYLVNDMYLYKTVSNNIDNNLSEKFQNNYLQNIPFGDQDFDNDGLTNAEEISLGTSIYNSDTDGNGITDVNEPSNIKLPEGTAFRIVENKKQPGTYNIEKAHKILKWIKAKPSKKNGIEKTTGLSKDKVLETYRKMQKIDIEQSQKNFKGFKI